MTDTWRGHAIKKVDPFGWVYADTGHPVAENPDRACGHCQKPNTAAGHDGCLDTLPGVENACCGHGQERDAYVVFDDGTRLAGAEAVGCMSGLASDPKEGR